MCYLSLVAVQSSEEAAVEINRQFASLSVFVSVCVCVSVTNTVLTVEVFVQ